jgi:hypothetical protein
MHVLPLPFGMALALLPRVEARRVAQTKAVSAGQPAPSARDFSRPETRYAAFRQLV